MTPAHKYDTQQLTEYIRTHQTVIASVESCTGGKIADRLTDVPGVSENFWGSWVVYDNTAKIELGVPPELIAQQGAVSSEAAVSLAVNGLKKLTATLAQSDAQMLGLIQPWKKLAVVSTTGIAGPAGGTPEYPVGLCHVGVAISDGSKTMTDSLKILAPTGLTRVEYKNLFAQKAIEFLLQCLSK
jgi:nicotinamide-nucleotide amidase